MTEDFIPRHEHEEFKEAMIAENTRQNHRIEKLEGVVDKINDLALSTHRLADKMEAMLEEQKEQGQRLSELESRDGKKWREVVKTAVAVVVTAVVTAAMVALGLK